MTGSAADFYDALAPFYHLNYADWEAGIESQGAGLEAILREHGVAPPAAVLDAACGIGTQTLGLAARGFRVTGSDLAPRAVERARREAAARSLPLDLSVADMRAVDHHHGRRFDAVIACDNSLPHLLSDAEILRALRAFHACTLPGGLCLVSVRDYEADVREGSHVRPPVLHDHDGQRRVVFQVWDFEGPVYRTSLFLVEDDGGEEPRTRVFRSRYYAVGITTLLGLMREAGFEAVERLDGPFYQPVLLGRRPAG